ncbi:MAG: cupin domain-containing protein [Bacteroidota bacterium]
MTLMKVRKPTPDEILETKNWSVWSKESSKFNWNYNDRELCYILEGEAIVKDKLGEVINFKRGDFVVFEKGLECEWEIISAIKKKYKFV